jgi:hypothetical protein
MKILYLNIILFIGIMVFCHVYMDKTINDAIRCGHIDRVPAKKIWTVWQGKNGNPDEACLVKYTLNGNTRTAEWWNVGNCNENIDIEINVHDYTCH